MIHILKREFIDSFKSIRSIIMILFITYISYKSAKFFDSNPGLIDEFADSGGSAGTVYTSAIMIIVVFLGFLFVFATSHDLISKEIELKTIRLLVTKVSRRHILLGKFLGTFLFWTVITSLSYGFLSFYAGALFPKDYVQMIVHLFYIVSFVLLISTIISHTKLTMFLGIIFGLTLPLIGTIAMFSNKWYMIPFKYLLPYKYLDRSIWLMLLPLTIAIIYIFLSYLVLQRRDL